MIDAFEDAHVEALYHSHLAEANIGLLNEAAFQKRLARDRGDHVAAARWHAMGLLYQEAAHDCLAIADLAWDKMRAANAA